MANQLDEMNPEIIEEGRDIHVIAKVLPVEVSVQEKMIPAIIMIIGIMIIFIALLSERYIMVAVGALVVIFPWWRLHQIKSEFNMMEQRIQTAASEIDNFMEQRVVILTNVSKLVEKSIAVDKDILVDIATRALSIVLEDYPDLQSQDTIRDAMQQNSYLQREITAARTLYNDAVNTWNREIFEFPFKKIVAAKEGRTTRIPFIAEKEIKNKARGVFF